ncbi:sigma-54-dependent Fis family transcriptional regulator [Alkalihalobacillus hwajinpoensis]|uniref:sigma-54-dependent Fis family transcriptional regulator n=1 Tax=Guptibacillus hwajinpoensis TaxID=208199 RepID=UPI0018843ED5|nr:sigma-54-dependent Fis family transcriptional regulator [Pseudalkalibacillus hwajinpoensis]MBF0707804.1 sigma-54-dependent Fis family transcriptional regulator [Pseudalkalibacillus hwajinpoensis]
MIKALVIAPYEGLIEIMREISEEVDDFELHTELGNLYEGVEVARRSETNGFDLIISRGGTASLVKEVVSIPVIDIQVSGYDILRLLTLVKGFSGKAAIVGFPNISQGAATICNLLDLDINTITIMKDVEVEGRLKGLRAEGYEVVIGDVFTVEAAKQLGMNGVLITSGKEAVMESLDEARRVYQLFSKLHEEVSVYQSIIDVDERMIGVMNMEGKVKCANQHFNAEFSNAMIENLPEMKEIIQSVYKTRTKQQNMLTLHNQLWNVSASLNEQYVILYFEKAFSNQTQRQSEEGKQYAVDVQTTVPHVLMTGKSKQIQEVMKQVDQYSQMDEPLWIIGETGNGKDAVAQSIYLKSKRNNEPFITIHCELLKEGQLTELLNEDFFRYHTNGIVYLKRMDRLDTYSQKELYQYINTSTGKMPRWIVSSKDEIAIHERDGTIDHDLFTLLGRLIIYIPPLRERVQDIEDLIPVFISEFHSKYSKQIVGIRQEAMKELIDYEWPRNVDQLKQVIEQLVLHSHSYYLEKEEVSSFMTLLKQRMEVNDVASNQIEVSGTLKEIEKQVITKVLEEEEMNQSKAAKRLGINRSTLWRKLKS